MEISRRTLIRSAAFTGAAAILRLEKAEARRFSMDTPPLTQAEMDAIAAAFGKKGTYNEAQATYVVPLPRNDLKMKIKGEAIPIPFGFAGWTAFKRSTDGGTAMAMGDTVLLQSEVNGLIDSAHKNGLEVAAIHNHFFYEEPRIFFMHLHGMGEPGDLANRYAAAIKHTKLFPANQPKPGKPPVKTGKELFNLAELDAIVGAKGAVNGPTYKYTIGRSDITPTVMGVEMTPAIGLNSWQAFAGTMERARVAGDIAMLEGEVNPVIKALRGHGIEVVALHHHMLFDRPRMIFLHYYGTGKATLMAKGFRAALDEHGKHGDDMPM